LRYFVTFFSIVSCYNYKLLKKVTCYR